MNPPPLDRAHWFTTEIQPHETLLRSWLAVRFPDLPDRDDVVQETFLRMLRLSNPAALENPKAFLFATARNLALNLLRNQRHERPSHAGEFDATTVLDERSDTPEFVSRRQEIALLNEALCALPERCREAFILRRLHGLSQKEIAARLGISEKTVENHSLLALRKCTEFFRRHERIRLPRVRANAPLPLHPPGLGHPEVRHA